MILRFIALGILFGFAASSLAAGADYTLRVGDKVRLTIFERPEIAGEYTIRSSGVLSVPSIGEVEAAGFTMPDLESDIAKRLGLKDDDKNHWVGIEVVEMQPIYILGGVKTPGSYPYATGMTVLHAISLAGGLRANIDIGPPDRFQVLNSREKLRHLQQSLAFALARHARLKAEYEGGDAVEFPEEILLYLNQEEAERAMQRELRIFEDRRIAAISEEEAYTQQKKVVDEEIRAHMGQMSAKVEAGKLLQEEIDDLEPNKGVVPRAHIRALERIGAQIEGDKRELAAFIARAKLQRQRIEQDSQSIANARRVAISEEINQIEDSMVQGRISIEELHITLARAEAEAASIAAPWAAGEKEIKIVRRTPNGIEELPGAELTELVPGDVIKVPLGLTEARRVMRKRALPQ